MVNEGITIGVNLFRICGLGLETYLTEKHESRIGHQYSVARAAIFAERRSAYMMRNAVVPTCMVTFLAGFSFHPYLTLANRLDLCATLFLSNSTLRISISSSLPHADTATYIDYCLNYSNHLIILAILMNLCVQPFDTCHFGLWDWVHLDALKLATVLAYD